MWNNNKIYNSDNYEEVPEDFKIEVPTFTDNEEEEVETVFKKPQNDWLDFFNTEMEKPYFKIIEEKYSKSIKNTTVYPSQDQLFRAFSLTPISKLKVIIIGQDPYPGLCPKTKVPFANGLAFSVNKKCSIPKSLTNMYRELQKCGYKKPETGELEHWAKQGVFLLNTQLSVEKGNANSHRFWNKFTDNVIKYIGDKNKKVVFVLMGGNALKKYKLIPKNKNTKRVITSHPSPLGYKKNLRSYPPFHNSKIFLEINNKLGELGIENIKW